MVTDGTSNTLMASEGYIGHAQMRSCSEHAERPVRPHDRDLTPSPTSRPPGPPRPPRSTYQINNCAAPRRQDQGRRSDRPHPLGQRRRLLLGLHHRHAAQPDRVDRQPAPPATAQRRQEPPDGLGLGRRERRRPHLHVAGGQQLPPRRRQRPVRRRQRPLRQELGQPGHLVRPWAPSPAARSSVRISTTSRSGA